MYVSICGWVTMWATRVVWTDTHKHKHTHILTRTRTTLISNDIHCGDGSWSAFVIHPLRQKLLIGIFILFAFFCIFDRYIPLDTQRLYGRRRKKNETQTKRDEPKKKPTEIEFTSIYVVNEWINTFTAFAVINQTKIVLVFSSCK